MRVTTVQVPSFAIEGTVRDFMAGLQKVSPYHQTKIWEAAKGRSLQDTIILPMGDEATAKTLLQQLFPTEKTVDVKSHTEFGKNYQVGIRLNRPVNCNCPDYINRSKSDPTHVCKHMSDVAIHPRLYGL